MMTLKQIASLGKELTMFLALFADYFRSRPGFGLGRVYVQGLLSDLERKNVEAIALEFDKRPRTLQRLLESVKWDASGVRDEVPALGRARTPMPRRSAASMNRERPRAATIRSAPRGSGSAVAARSTTASLACI